MKKNEIFELLDRFEHSKLTKFTYEEEGTKLILEQEAFPTLVEAVERSECKVSQETGVQEVKSPLVGTFYAAPSPGASPYTKIGQEIKKGDVIGIIEAMKLMNEVTAPVSGTMSEILVEDESLVQYHQMLFKIKEKSNV